VGVADDRGRKRLCGGVCVIRGDQNVSKERVWLKDRRGGGCGGGPVVKVKLVIRFRRDHETQKGKR